MPHIVIIGAGIPGVTSAYALNKRGYDVTVIERERHPASKTSFANGGQLSACNSEVWNKTATVKQGLRWMLRSDAPLLFNPRPSWHKFSWLAEFMRHIPNYRANTIATARLAIRSRDFIFRTAEAEKIEFDVERRGILHLYRDRAAFEAAGKTNALLIEAGLDRRAVTPEEMRDLEPALTGKFFGGFYTPSDSTGDSRKFTIGLAAVCRRLGVRFLYDTEVEGVAAAGPSYRIRYRSRMEADSACEELVADAVVICAGVASRAFARLFGDRINIYPVKGYSITVELDDRQSREAAPRMGLLDTSASIVASRLGETRYRVAGTAEFNGSNYDIRADRIRPLVLWTRRLFPGIGAERVVPWAGLRPMTPNMMPRVGAGSQPGVFYNTGHGNHGWTLAGATAEILAESVAMQFPVSNVLAGKSFAAA
jgi:D-amino-acid dehydrogenase